MKPFKRRIQDSADGPKTYISPLATINGSIEGQGGYIFCGRVVGDCNIDGPVTLADGAHWKGTLRAKHVVVAGTVEGDVVADERIELAPTARVTGRISGNSIAVAEGAIIEGEINVASGDAPIRFKEKRRPEKPDSPIS